MVSAKPSITCLNGALSIVVASEAARVDVVLDKKVFAESIVAFDGKITQSRRIREEHGELCAVQQTAAAGSGVSQRVSATQTAVDYGCELTKFVLEVQARAGKIYVRSNDDVDLDVSVGRGAARFECLGRLVAGVSVKLRSQNGLWEWTTRR